MSQAHTSLPSSFTLLLLLLSTYAFGQNLLPNPSFENNTGFPSGPSQFSLANDWSNANGSATPDYYHTNGNSGAQLPNSLLANIPPHSGEAIMGFIARRSSALNTREYLSTILNTPMQVGEPYQVSFYLSNGISSSSANIGVNGIGIYFSESAITQEGANLLSVSPQIIFEDIIFNNEWTLYSFLYTPDSAYTHCVIGNFKSEDDLLIAEFNGSTGNEYAYYFIDDLSLVQLPSFTNTLPLCSGSSTNLAGPEGASLYQWTAADQPSIILGTSQNLVVSPTYNTTYIVSTDIGTNGITVQIYNALEGNFLGNLVNTCDDNQQVKLQVLLEGGGNFLWNTGSTDREITVTSAGLYHVEVDNICGTFSDSAIVTISSPVADLFADTSILCEGDTLILAANTVDASYSWQDGSSSPTFFVTNSGSYWVDIVRDCGTVRRSTYVQKTSCDPACSMVIVNAFSPNNDGINDYFSPISACEVLSFRCYIYDRWGKLIFESLSFSNAWDGTHKGNNCSIGTYAYTIKHESSDAMGRKKVFTESGKLHLIR